jgi:hypothetical protein
LLDVSVHEEANEAAAEASSATVADEVSSVTAVDEVSRERSTTDPGRMSKRLSSVAASL